ncbi:transmembrane channel-like protein 6b [Oncorhynchus masou masou]|uniref:transmembrane channel-like protein 6b n=1 Tax=Oncorhynchus masou masou TaxID=90313 RepID=UPI003183A1E2
MAHSVNFDLTAERMEAGLESPADEEGVHDSFNQLIEDQRQEALELQELQRDLDEEERDSVAYLSSPGQEIWRGSAGRGEEEGGRQLDPLLEERWSSATLKVLSSMPSRTIGRSRGAVISQYYNRTMKLRRRRQSRPSIKDFSRSARPSIRGYGMETDCMETEGVDEEGRKRDQLVNNLQNLSLSDRVRMLRGMPLSVAEKSDLRRLADRKGQRSNHSQIPCCSQLKYHIIIALRHSWYSCLSFLHSLQLWQVRLSLSVSLSVSLSTGGTTNSNRRDKQQQTARRHDKQQQAVRRRNGQTATGVMTNSNRRYGVMTNSNRRYDVMTNSNRRYDAS